MTLARLLRVIGTSLRRAADRLDPPPAPLLIDGDAELERAEQLAHEILLRAALYRALRRHHPAEERGQA